MKPALLWEVGWGPGVRVMLVARKCDGCCVQALGAPLSTSCEVPTWLRAGRRPLLLGTFGCRQRDGGSARSAGLGESLLRSWGLEVARSRACSRSPTKASRAGRLSSLRGLARRHTTRLETRTKESIHMCEYASTTLVCGMKVAGGT